MFMNINRSIAESKARRENNEEGFTLIELLVVVLIIGVLSAIAIPIFLNQQKAAKISAIESDLSSAKTALVADMVSNPDFDIALVDFTALDGFKGSNDVTLAFVGTPTPDSFCIVGTHTDVDSTVAEDQRSVGDTGGVVRSADCTTP